MTGGRDRLAHALGAARSAKADGPLKALPIQLRTLGVGQTVAMLQQQDRAGISRALIDWVGRVAPPGNSNAASFLAAWRAQTDPLTIRRVETEAIAWAVDVRLLYELISLDNSSGPVISRPWEDRDGQAAALAADPTVFDIEQEELLRALHSLPNTFAANGVLRTLGWLARVKKLHLLVRIVRDRLCGVPGLAIPDSPVTFAQWLTDPANADGARLAEAEAVEWSCSLKHYVRAYALVTP